MFQLSFMFRSLLHKLLQPLSFARPRPKARRMDALVQESIRQVQLAQKSDVPWREAYDRPWSQAYHTYSNADAEWTAVSGASDTSPPDSTTAATTKKLALYSWNIDFMLPFPNSRMAAAIEHLKFLIAAHPSPHETASVIFLAECVVGDLKLLAADPWVQSTFHLTDINGSFWQSGHYGTTTLVDRRLQIKDCFRVHYLQTRMERDGLFVDLKFRLGPGETKKTLRLCNTHLESLALEPAYRPPQLALCAQYMKDPAASAAILAGDLNAIQDFDRTLPSTNGLRDAYLELGGNEDDAEGGHTWGQQAATAQRERFGTSRMDKVLFCGESLRLLAFERFGAGVEVRKEEERIGILDLGFEAPWVTDHLGVQALFEML